MRAPLADAARAVDRTFLTFDAGRYRTDHSHLDALGMTMYSGGATVLPEAGLFTYEPGVGFAYFHGTRGHNTVMVDGADQASGDATPGPFGTFPHGTWASGTSGLYPGVTHDRSVVLLRQDLVLVLDRLASAEEHDYAQLWHLPAGSHVTQTADGISVTPAAGAAGPALALTQADVAGLDVRTVTGATNPMQGWISRAYGAKTPSPALEFHRRGRAARLATLLATGPGASGGSTVRQSAVPGGRRVEVCGPRGDYVVTVTGEGTPSQRVVAAGCGSSVAASDTPAASTSASVPVAAPPPASAAAPARPSASCRTSVHVPPRSGAGRVLAIRYRTCRPARLTVTVRRHGRVVVRRSRAVGVRAGTIAIHGIRPGRVRVTARIGSRRAVVRWTEIERRPKR
jgi:Heparinase II/III-like protein